LNKAVGGVSNSAHTFGYAADTVPANGLIDKYEAFVATEFAKSGVAFDQIIVEKSKHSRWVHVAIRNGKAQQRMQCFKLNV
jgi:hypothetical protein